MDNLDRQKRALNKIIGKRNKVQVYDRETKSTKMVPKSNSSIKSASSRSRSGSTSFSKKKSGGCGGCSRKRKTGN
jgi:hypothetical protein